MEDSNIRNTQQNTAKVEIFTDGACRNNPGSGGWGVLMRTITTEGAKIDRELYGGERHTTNNRMELRAVIEGLQTLKFSHQVVISTDSKYVKDGFTQWLPNWRRTGWMTKARKPVKNKDLWQALYQAAAYHQVEWKWIKGHSGHPENERADALANKGIDECL